VAVSAGGATATRKGGGAGSPAAEGEGEDGLEAESSEEEAASESGSAAAPPTDGGEPSSSAAPAATGGAPAAPAPEIVASKDVLPQFGDIPKPKVEQFGPAPRQSKMPGVGGSKPAIEALFEELSIGSVAKRVYEGDGGNYVLVQLTQRVQPNVAEFEKTADAEIRRMREARSRAALLDWLRFRCEALKKSNRIRPAAELIRETDDKGNPAPTVYRPCMSLDLER